jgi:hypothetical protein
VSGFFTAQSSSGTSITPSSRYYRPHAVLVIGSGTHSRTKRMLRWAFLNVEMRMHWRPKLYFLDHCRASTSLHNNQVIMDQNARSKTWVTFGRPLNAQVVLLCLTCSSPVKRCTGVSFPVYWKNNSQVLFRSVVGFYQRRMIEDFCYRIVRHCANTRLVRVTSSKLHFSPYIDTITKRAYNEPDHS